LSIYGEKVVGISMWDLGGLDEIGLTDLEGVVGKAVVFFAGLVEHGGF
jgi:hypothetical protein